MKKHSVQDIASFCGWDRLLGIVKKARYYRDKALIATLFETGGRVSEVLMLRNRNFDFSNKTFIIVKGMPLVKRKEMGAFRSFPIRRDDPLVPYLEDWVKRFERDDKIFSINRTRVFQIVRAIGPDLYPHWFRAQRASQLAEEYGFGVLELMEFFAWKSMVAAARYAHLGYKTLAERMRK